jgi:hypothetical protein
MRGADSYDNKQRAGAAAIASQVPTPCFRLHKNFAGMACPDCGMQIDVAPWDSTQTARFTGGAFFVGSRPAGEAAQAAEVACPITEREHELAAEHAALTAEINELKQKISRGDEKPATGPVQTVIDALTGRRAGTDPDEDSATRLLAAEGRWDRVNRLLRAERLERAGRMRAWRAKHAS